MKPVLALLSAAAVVASAGMVLTAAPAQAQTSVRVALGAEEARVEPETSAAHADPIVASRSAPAPAAKVTRRVRDAIRRRTVER